MTAIFASMDVALDDLELPDDEGKPLELPAVKAAPTHQVMRFKVPLDDAPALTRLIERVMKEQGYTEDDSMTNAGNALVYLLTNVD
jgi:hypothetical protein